MVSGGAVGNTEDSLLYDVDQCGELETQKGVDVLVAIVDGIVVSGFKRRLLGRFRSSKPFRTFCACN